MEQTVLQAKNASILEQWLEKNLPHIKLKDKSEYRNQNTPITFICSIHGEYIAQPQSVKHSKHGCKKCGGQSKQLPYTAFITQAIEIHGEKYSYYSEKESGWKGSSGEVKIHCTVCQKSFSQTGNSHLQGRGCPICANKAQQLPYDDFITKAKEIHGERYKYHEEQKAEWNGRSHKVKIFCPVCETDFWQIGGDHLQGSGCPVCANKALQLPYIDFISQAKLLHGNRYSYYEEKEAEWDGSNKNVKIFCTVCEKSFFQRASTHLKGYGCPICNTASGKDSEKNFLENFELASSPCYLYYIKIADSYKIGITNNIANRLRGESYELLKSRETIRLFAWRAEQMILDEFKEYKKRNDSLKAGSTECFGVDISILDNFEAYFNYDFTEPID